MYREAGKRLKENNYFRILEQKEEYKAYRLKLKKDENISIKIYNLF